ncbi:MAG: hypothetical protein RIQ75_2508, partial [Pseudomonadota bacterium]
MADELPAEQPRLTLRLRRDASGALAWFRANYAQPRFRLAVRLLAGLLILFGLFWLIFARNLPSADKLLTYQPPLPTYV